MSEKNSVVRVELGGLATLLTVLFVGLKLGGVISWSWWWVLSPLWISFLIGSGFIIAVLLIFLLAALLKK